MFRFLLAVVLPATLLAFFIPPADEVAGVLWQDIDLDGDNKANYNDVENYFLTNYDANGDGRVTSFEFDEGLFNINILLSAFDEALFNEFNFDNNDHLDATDFAALVAVVDTNNDDVVTWLEFEVYFNRVYNELVG